MSEQVAFIGIGNMGNPMAENLVKAGKKVKVFDISKKMIEKAKEKNLDVVENLDDLITSEVTTVITMLPEGKQSKEVYLGKNGIASAHGKAGTALIFVDNLVHGSAQNMSPMDRTIFSVILNPCNNAQTKFTRPDYKHGQDFKPIKASTINSLI